ncbi:unnamed protein product [Tenebrio molitor]|nr:unnamed protein product [Tenebrio molitor]
MQLVLQFCGIIQPLLIMVSCQLTFDRFGGFVSPSDSLQDWGCPLLFGLWIGPPCLAGFVAFFQARVLWLLSLLLLLLGLNPTSDGIFFRSRYLRQKNSV